ncbi:MAG TPA: TolC family protein [Vicinamibacterales bacterium]|jgi:outer membrane protein TolC
MKLHVGIVAMFVAVAAGAGLGRADDGAQASSRITLEQAIERGLATSHRLAEIGARQQGAAAAVESRRVASLPLVSAQAGYTRTNHVQEFGIAVPGSAPRIIYPDVPDNLRTRLDFQWPIYTFGRTDALERAARAELEATGLDLATARNDLTLEVTRGFWAVVTANESVRVVEESLKRMDASLEDMRNRLKVGLVPPNDVLSMEAQRSRQQMLLIQVRNMREQALADLRRLTGAAPDAPLDVDATLESAPAPVATASVLVAEARKARPDRGAIETRIKGAGERREAAVANRRPVLSVGAGFDVARPNPRIFPRAGEWNDSWDASVNFTWTLWDFGRVRAEVAEATAAQAVMRERLAEFDSVLDVDVRQRRLDLESATAAVTAARDAVRAATEARRVVGDRFAAGVATSTEVLDAQVALLQAGLDRTQALANVRLAEARLNRSLGR